MFKYAIYVEIDEIVTFFFGFKEVTKVLRLIQMQRSERRIPAGLPQCAFNLVSRTVTNFQHQVPVQLSKKVNLKLPSNYTVLFKRGQIKSWLEYEVMEQFYFF